MKKYIILFLFSAKLFSQVGPWIFSNRTHPELKWFTIETKNFRVHFHNGIDSIAIEGAKIAEQVLPTLESQIDFKIKEKIDLTFTSEDEVTNGYASWTNTVFIWVDQNDTPIWLEDEKWLYQVVAHELQHIVLLNSLKSWLADPFGLIFSGTPGWFIEGSAEYFTERWRPGRADISHKIHISKNNTHQMDPHNDGFSKMLYLSSRFGDSTIIKIIKYRDKDLKIFNFEDAFSKLTGITIKQFEEDWRRVINTYYYGVRAQKETYEEIGKLLTLPIKFVNNFKISFDSTKIIATGKLDKSQQDESLILAIEKENKKINNIFSFFDKDSGNILDNQKKYDIKEIDFGSFHSFDISKDGNSIVSSKYHYANNQELVWDLKIYDLKTSKQNWITNSMRATFPNYSNDGKRICFVSHKNNVSNIFTYDLESKKIKQITNFKYDTQILSPQFSFDDNKIVYSASRKDGNLNIELLDLVKNKTTILTINAEADYSPIWINENEIIYTSHKNKTPNIFKLNITDNIQNQISDVGDAVQTLQLAPKSKNIFALTLNDVDTIRFLSINPNRNITTRDFEIRQSFKSWIEKKPDKILLKPNSDYNLDIIARNEYSVLKNMHHLFSFAFPYLDGTGLFAFTSFYDGLGRNIFEFTGSFEKNKSGIFASYISASLPVLLNIEYYENYRSSFRFYDKNKNGLFEYLNGISFKTSLQHNFGENLQNNHNFDFNYKFYNRLVEKQKEFTNEFLPIPENAKEEILELKYQFVDYRNEYFDYFKPVKRNGIKIDLQKSINGIYGKYNYSKLSADLFSSIPINFFSIYGRLKFEAIDGDAPKQDYIGITRDLPFYVPFGDDISDLIKLPENHSLRGIDTVKFGDRISVGTIEFRIPLIKKLPINIFGFSIGSVSINAFTDFGNAWFVGTQSKNQLMQTAGYETKFAIQAEENSILFFSSGEGQEISNFRNNKNNFKKYFRMGLVSPF